MSSTEHKQMIDKIEHGLQIAEREMLEEKARKEYKEGKGVSLKNHEAIDRYFESL